MKITIYYLITGIVIAQYRYKTIKILLKKLNFINWFITYSLVTILWPIVLFRIIEDEIYIRKLARKSIEGIIKELEAKRGRRK